MKKVKRTLVTLLTLALMMSVFSPMGGKAFAASKVKLSRTKTTLYVGDSETLALLGITEKQAKKVTWKSSKTSVATVNKSGKVKAKKAGKSTVTAKLNKKKYTCKVTVKKAKIQYVEVTPEPDAPEQGNQIYQNDVTKAMTSAAYWYNKLKNPNKVLMTKAEIEAANELNYSTSGTAMRDLKKMSTYDGEARKQSLMNELTGEVRPLVKSKCDDELYVDKNKLEKDAIDAWFAEMKANIEAANVTKDAEYKFGVVVKRADLAMAPTSSFVAYSASDSDSEFVNSSANINEPVIVDLVTADNKFTHVYTDNCNGWVETEKIAICDDKDEWEAQTYPENPLVVKASHLTLEQSYYMPDVSALDLYMGTILPMVPKEAITGSIAERYPWYSYTVYIPTRDKNGKMQKQMALISSHHDVSIGYPAFTQKNILEIAFNLLGDRYGWGGCLGAYDCSLYMRDIYRCFGLAIPRNTTHQSQAPYYHVDFSEDIETKKKEISKLDPTSILFCGGHVMMYIGDDAGKQYVISDLGSLKDTDWDGVKSVYSVSVNSLDVRRGKKYNFMTWLEALTCGFTPWKKAAS